MIQHAIILSLQITAIYILFQEGMLLERLRGWIETLFDQMFIWLAKKTRQPDYEITGKQWSKHWIKPVFGCVICMSGIWTIILTWSINIPLIFVVCGINVIIDKFINYEGAA